MNNQMMMVVTALCCAALFTGCRHTGEVTVLYDDFAALDTGQVSVDVGAHIEYHYLQEAAPRGNWEVSVFRSVPGFRVAWRIQEDTTRYLYQSYNTAESKSASRFHPMVALTNDILWENYTATVRFAPEALHDEVGIAFRYVHDRNTYLLALNGGNKVQIKKVYNGSGIDPEEEVIAEADFAYEVGARVTASITVDGPNIRARIQNGPTLEAVDTLYGHGKLALFADVPARFYDVRITMPQHDYDVYLKKAVARDDEERALRAQNPKPVVWKKLKTPGFGVGRNLRFGDLDGDGVKDVLVTQVISHGPRNQYDEAGCLTAMTFDGDILWQVGKPDPDNWVLFNDVAVQIHDFNNDGKNEVIYASGFEIKVLNGQTGQLIKRIPTPKDPRDDAKFDRILGDCLFFCDVSGRGYAGDLLIKDRYWNVWVYDNDLKLNWHAEVKTGHYPYPFDADGDGKDELLIGYAMFDDDGTKLWEKEWTDHMDGIAILPLKDGADPTVFIAASDEGFAFLDKNGKTLTKYNVGHVQNPAAANFRDDLPGMEIVTINFWGNQGIINFFDADMNLYKAFEPNQFGSMCLPINWTGKSEEFFVHNANVKLGGMYDGWGRRVVLFPDDGHPDMANAVLDITGDCRDEVVVWNPEELWIYTQEDNPKVGKLYKPKRNPLYNYSNYQATVSVPGWNE